MENLIPLINTIRDVFTESNIKASDVGIHLPEIAVVGSQSVGKTSVLEALVRRDFLPRGHGIVTRRPLILQLVNIPLLHGAVDEEWGIFAHAPNFKLTCFDQIRREIEKETDRVTSRLDVSSQPIILTIHSTKVINLTLIDLPGLTRNPAKGQPENIELKIRNIVQSYISKPRCIILAVSAANVDIVNSESLEMARAVDPDGLRTIGVLTKLDLMDSGTDAYKVLQNEVYPLRLGYVGVVCRSQRDIEEKKGMMDAIKQENKFFDEHSKYRHISNKLGVPYLEKTLNGLLRHHIAESLPGLKAQLDDQIHKHENELSGYGEPIKEQSQRRELLVDLLAKFEAVYKASIDGRRQDDCVPIELVGGARIHYIFNDNYARKLAEFDPLHSISIDEIRATIRNVTGPNSALFIPESAFEIIIKKQICKLEEPSKQCCYQVYQELRKIVETCRLTELDRFPTLKSRIMEVMEQHLRSCLEPCQDMIKNLIDVEMGYINKSHEDFRNGFEAFPGDVTSDELGPTTSQDKHSESQSSNSGAVRGRASVAEAKRGPTHPSPAAPNINGPVVEANQPERSFFSFVKKPQRPTNETHTQLSTSASNTTSKQRGQNYLNQRVDSNPLRLNPMPDKISLSSELTKSEEYLIRMILSVCKSYFNIVRKNMSDLVPKAIMHFMVNTSKELLRKVLDRELNKEDLLGELLKEEDHVAKKRFECGKTLILLKKAKEELTKLNLY